MNRWALFLSGRGTTAQAFMDLADTVDIGLVISNRTNAAGLARARRMGIATWSLQKSTSWKLIHQRLIDAKINRIFLLGFMKLLPGEFVQLWHNRIYNVHPSLLPAYPGLHAIEKSFHDQAEMGVSVHQVVTEMDAGPLLYQKSIQATRDLAVAQTKIAITEQRLIRELGMR